MSNGPGFDYTALIGAVGTEIGRWHELTEQKQAFIASDPCAGAVAFAELSANWIGPLVDDIQAASSVLSSSLHSAVTSSILNRGHAPSGVVGGQTLQAFVTSQAAPAPLVPPWVVSGGPPAVALFLDGLLPSGSDLLNARSQRWSSSDGLQVAGVPGLFLSPAGKLTGPSMVQWVADWMGGQLGANGPSPSLFPAARMMLEALTGSSVGSRKIGGWGSFGVWAPSDGYTDASKGGRITFVLADAMATMNELEQLCTGGRITADLRETIRSMLPFAALGAAVWIARR